MRDKILGLFKNAQVVLHHYPMVLVSAIIAALAAVVGIEISQVQTNLPVTKIVILGCLGISLFFAAEMISQRFGRRVLFQIIPLALLIVMYFFLPDREVDFTERYAFVLVPVFILSHLMVSFGAFLKKKSDFNFWSFNKNLFINTILTAIFTGVLVGGVVLAILAVDQLFDLDFPELVYPKTLSFLAIFGSCFIFLLFAKRGLSDLEKNTDYPQILKFFTQLVLIPLLLIYLVILYFYSAKILINWELPRGWVSYLILAYSVVGMLAILLVHPIRGSESKSWVKIFSKVFYFTLIPLLVLLSVAIKTRILEYGFTEPRYFVVALAVWICANVIYFIFFRNASIKFIPISLFITGFLSLALPYLNAYSVSVRSQKTELAQVLKQNNLLENGEINFNKKVDYLLAEEIADKLNFLYERDEKDYVWALINRQKFEKVFPSDVNSDYFSIRNTVSGMFTQKSMKDSQRPTEITASTQFLPVSDYDLFFILDENAGKTVKVGSDTFYFADTSPGKSFEIILNDNQKTDLQPTFKRFVQDGKWISGNNEVPEISAEFDLGNYHGKVFVKSIYTYQKNGSRIFLNQKIIFIRKK